MTTDEWIAKQRERVNLLKDNKPLAIAASTTHARQMQRIFSEGQGTVKPIGSYSTKPIYISPRFAPKKFPTKGKSGQTTFKSGNPHKTGYFAGGYKEFRGVQGRQAGFVDLALSGQLRSDLANSLTRDNNDRWVTGTRRRENTNKLEGAENRFGRIFGLTQSERKLFSDIIFAEWQKLRK